MASSTSTVRVIFDGSVRGLQQAARAADAAISGVGRSAASLAKPLAGLGAAGGAVQALAGLAAAASQLAPAALILPGALLAAGAAMATLKLATAGFGEAVSAADPAAFAEATKNMGASAVATAQAVRDLNPQFIELKKSVQDRFFRGFADDVKALGSAYLPVLKDGLGGIADGFNAMGREGARALLAPASVGAVNTILGNTSQTLLNMRGALGNAISGFLGLGSIGSTYLPGLGTAIDNVTAKFKTWVEQGTADGSIKAMIDGAIAGFRDLGAIVGNVGSIIGSIFRGLSGDVSSPLASLRELTAALAEFFQSAAAQGPLQALGETMRVVAGVLKDVLLAALRALGPLIQAVAPFVQVLAQSLGTALVGAMQALGPPLAQLLGALGDSLAPLLPIIAQAFVGIAQALGPVLGALAPVATMLGQALVPVFKMLAPLVQEIATAIGSFLVVAIQSIAPLLPPLIQAFGQIVAAVLPLIPPIINLASSVLPMLAFAFGSVVVPAVQIVAGIISNVLVPAIRIIITVVQTVANGVTTAFETIRGAVTNSVNNVKGVLAWFGSLPGLFTGWINGARNAIVNGFNSAVAWVRGVPGMVQGALGNLGGLLTGSGRSLVDGFLNGLRAAWDRVVSFVRSGVQTVRNLFPFSPAKTGPFSGTGYVTYSGKALTNDFANSLRRGMPGVVSAASGLMNAASVELAPRNLIASAAALSADPAASSAQGTAPSPTVISVFIDGQEFRGMIKTEIAENGRQTRRGVSSGAYRGL